MVWQRTLHVSPEGLDFDNVDAPSRLSWLHLVGKDAEAAKLEILSENDELQVLIVPDGAMVTMDHREDRVRLYVDQENKVVQAPRLG